MAGPIKPDMDLGRKVRRMTLRKIEKLFEKEENQTLESNEQKLYEAVLIKLAGSALPRINELSGENGKPIIIQVAQEGIDKYKLYEVNGEPIPDIQGQPQV